MRLRKAIQQTRGLAVLVTENTRTSRWLPWEMGAPMALLVQRERTAQWTNASFKSSIALTTERKQFASCEDDTMYRETQM
jgi:hypothetical protein